MSLKNCKNCGNRIFDEIFGEYKCYVKQRRCAPSEVANGCSDWSEKKAVKVEKEKVRVDGATFTPHVSEDGVISWTNDQDLPNPESVNIKGPKGDKGVTGPQGPTGPAGKDGTSVTHSWNGSVLTITSASGTSSADLRGPAGEGGTAVVEPLIVNAKSDMSIDRSVNEIITAILTSKPVYLQGYDFAGNGLSGLCVGVYKNSFVFSPHIADDGQFVVFSVDINTGKIGYFDVAEVFGEKISGDINDMLEQAKESGEFDGADGFSPTVSVEDISGGHRVTITDKDGEKTFDVMDGEGGSGGGQADWSVNDPNADGYIKNRPFYGYTETTVTESVLASGTYTSESMDYFLGAYVAVVPTDSTVEIASMKYTVIFDGVEYKNIEVYETPVGKLLGNGALIAPLFEAYGLSAPEDTGEPFVLNGVFADSSISELLLATDITQSTTHELSLMHVVETISDVTVKVPDKYLPPIHQDVVRYDAYQTLTDKQKTRACNNIGAMYSGLAVSKTELFRLLSGELTSLANDESEVGTIATDIIKVVGMNACIGNVMLRVVELPSVRVIDINAFRNCERLTDVKLGNIVTIQNAAFLGCWALDTVVLYADAVPVLHDDVFTHTKIDNGGGYIYVPSALIEEYKVAQNWSTYASQFRAIEDYPEICRWTTA